MGLFDSFTKLVKATVDTALLPVDVIKDVVTLGGAVEGKQAATPKRLEKILEDLQEAYDEIDD